MTTSSSGPIVDVAFDRPNELMRVAVDVRHVLSEQGFYYACGHGVEPALIERAFEASRGFFEQPVSEKTRFAYTDVASNFGYQGVGGESLDPRALPDLKEAFTMRGEVLQSAPLCSWPSEMFSSSARELFSAALACAQRLLSAMCLSLELPSDFFATRHHGENVTLRFLRYPGNQTVSSALALGAGAHTDYGSLTLLFQDDVGGLEWRNREGTWQSAPPIGGSIVVNTGDLMERWTNGQFRSTLHRVKPMSGPRDRYAIALFVDPDSDVLVECIPSCRGVDRPARFAPIRAGEHLRQKIAATHR